MPLVGYPSYAFSDFLMNLSAYLQFNNSNLPPKESIIVVTSTISVSPVFILHHFIRTSIQSDQAVVLVSFVNDFEELLLLSRKWGFSLVSNTCSGKLIYIDGLTKLYDDQLDKWSTKCNKIDTIYVRLTGISNFDDIFSTICSGIEQASLSGSTPSLILWGLDFLIASEILSPSDLLFLLSAFQEMVHYCVVTLNVDSALLNPKKRPYELEINYSSFVYAIIHKAYSIISLWPLPSGRTKEVTGMIRVSRGSGYYSTKNDSFSDTKGYEGFKNSQFEMLYCVHDLDVRIFPKGASF